MKPFLARLAACGLSAWAVYKIVNGYVSNKPLFTFIVDWSVPGMGFALTALFFLYVLFGKGK